MRRAGVIGLGLIGGSVGLRLRELGWWVSGVDTDPARREAALDVGAADESHDSLAAVGGTEVTFVATPVTSIAAAAGEALAAGAEIVTDVGSVKGPVVAQVDHPRFVGGHPMAGSEQEGLVGARADLFSGAVWVLTPGPGTDDAAYAGVRAVVASLGADIVAIEPDQHDTLVAMVSHVPHLAAATLMELAGDRSEEHRALLRLAAGGFRDMTRIAAGHPGIWPDICAENRQAITSVLDDYIASLGVVRDAVDRADRATLLASLQRARAARLNLPTSVPQDVDLAEMRVPVLDRPGELAQITTLATEVDINIYDLEIAHSSEGRQGVVIMVVAQHLAERLTGALMARGYRPTWQPLET